MHLKLQIKHYAAQTDSKKKNPTETDKRQASRRPIIHGEERKQKKKEYIKMGISRSPDVAQNIHV